MVLHDGAPTHIILTVRRHLTKRFPNRSFGRFGSVAWPARFSNLNSLGFYLWGDMKTKMYRGEIDTVDVLRRVFS